MKFPFLNKDPEIRAGSSLRAAFPKGLSVVVMVTKEEAAKEAPLCVEIDGKIHVLLFPEASEAAVAARARLIGLKVKSRACAYDLDQLPSFINLCRTHNVEDFAHCVGGEVKAFRIVEREVKVLRVGVREDGL